MDSIKKNFILQTAYRLLRILTPLITAPYISRVLGADNLGIFSYTYSIASCFVIFSMLGIESHGNRSIARVRENKQELNRVFSEILCLHLIVSGMCTVLYFLFVQAMMQDHKVQALLQGAFVLSAVFDVSWLFFGLEKFQLTVTRDMIIKLVSIASIFIFVKAKTDLWKYTAIMSVSPLLSQLVLWPYVFKEITFEKIQLKHIFSHLKPLLVLFFAVIATQIYRMMDKMMLGYFGFLFQLGCYENADKIVRIPVGLITSLGTVMLPQMSNLYGKNDLKTAEKYMEISIEFVFFMASALLFGLSAVARDFSSIFLGEEFAYSGNLIVILCISILFMSWNNLIRTQYLIPLGYDKIYLIAVWAGAIANLLLNIVLIRRYDAVGAAVATDVAYFVVSLFQTIPIAKKVPLMHYLKKSIPHLINGTIMFICVKGIDYFTEASVFTLMLEILCGAVVYLALSCLLVKKSCNFVSFTRLIRHRKKEEK